MATVPDRNADRERVLLPYVGKFMGICVVIIAACAVAALIYYVGFSSHTPPTQTKTDDIAAQSETVDLTQSQLDSIKIEPVSLRAFHIEVQALGSVVYHEKDIPHAGGTKFVVANIRESDSMLVHVGEPVEVSMTAYPGQVFTGKISTLGVTVYDSGGDPAVDPNTHRITARCEIADPKNQLYPGMLAAIAVQVQKEAESVAVPQSGVVREGDGTMVVWVTKDRHHFTARTVKIGLQQAGFDQITEGLEAGELVATDGALFIDNALNGSSE